MFLQLAHTRMDVYNYSYALALEAYRITKDFPDYERYNMTSQIRRAALSIRLNISEGSSRSSALERRRFYEIARGSLIEIYSALDIVVGLGYSEIGRLKIFGDITFKVLSGLIDKPGGIPGD